MTSKLPEPENPEKGTFFVDPVKEALIAERDQLKRELEERSKLTFITDMQEKIRVQAKEIERLKSHIAGLFIKDDPWKAKAERYEKALREIEWMTTVAISRDGTSEGIVRIQGTAKSALSETEGK